MMSKVFLGPSDISLRVLGRACHFRGLRLLIMHWMFYAKFYCSLPEGGIDGLSHLLMHFVSEVPLHGFVHPRRPVKVRQPTVFKVDARLAQNDLQVARLADQPVVDKVNRVGGIRLKKLNLGL